VGKLHSKRIEVDKMEKLKVFISQPMIDKTDEQILNERKRAISIIKKKYGKNAEILDSFIKVAPHDSTPVWFLGKSLEILSQANLAYFIGDWKKYRGCKIENIVAHEYGIDTIEE
jgi:hypothetical protein